MSTKYSPLVAPPAPSLSIYVEGTKIINPAVSVGGFVTLSCKSGGGSPTPSLTLYLGDQLVGSSVPGSTLQYTFTVHSSHDAVQVYCAAQNKMVQKAVHSQAQHIQLKCKKDILLYTIQ